MQSYDHDEYGKVSYLSLTLFVADLRDFETQPPQHAKAENMLGESIDSSNTLYRPRRIQNVKEMKIFLVGRRLRNFRTPERYELENENTIKR